MAFNSWSSRSFRKAVLMDSIISVFGTKASSLGPEHTATIYSEAEAETDTEAKDPATCEKMIGIAPANSHVSCASKKPVHVRTPSSGTVSFPREGEVARADPFAGCVEGGVDYQSMAWWQAGMVMIAETISLGILSLPAALSTLGLIIGLTVLVGLGVLATYTGFVIGQFKLRYPHVHSMADAGEILFGRIGREVLGAGQLIFFIFVMGSHLLTFSIMMNAITSHATCTILFMVVGTVLSLLFTLPRTLKNLSYYSIASFVSIIGAVGITMIGVSISRPGHTLDHSTGHFVQNIHLFPQQDTSFHTAFLAIANIVFAYAGHVAFFSFISELKQPTDFPKALALLQCSDIAMYITASVVIYYYTGTNVRSPALDSASPVVRKVAYGVAIPTIVIAGVVNGHVAVKYLYVRLLRDREGDVMHRKSAKAYGIWAAICAMLWTIAWVIAEGVPVFNDLLGLTSALFASWFTFGLSGMMWMSLNLERKGRWGIRFNGKRSGWSAWALFAVNVLNIVVGASICVIGLYASGKSISTNTVTQKPFSCADNSSGRR